MKKPKFKVGDKVIITAPEHYGGWAVQKEICTIKVWEINPKIAWVYRPNGDEEPIFKNWASSIKGQQLVFNFYHK